MLRQISVYNSLPKELFRVNNGPRIQLRPWSPGRHSFDIVAYNGRVRAKALDPISYKAPNGASMRPNSAYQQDLVSRLFRGQDVIVYSIPRGTRLPNDLLLVHERTDHYSLQPASDMTLIELNDKLTGFFLASGTCYTRNQWLRSFPAPTDFPPFT